MGEGRICEATAYLVGNGKEKEIMRDVALVEVQGKTPACLETLLAMKRNSRPKSKKSTCYSIRLLLRSFRQHSVENEVERE